MRTLNDVYSAFKLKKSAVNRISKEVKKAAIDESIEISKQTRTLLIRISDKAYPLSVRFSHNIIYLQFQIFEVFPYGYYFFNACFHNIKRKMLVAPQLKSFIWHQLVKYLSGEDYHAIQVKLALRHKFFTHQETVIECWLGLMKCQPNRAALLNILEVAAPVPWDLKEPVYHSLLNDIQMHHPIFKSIFASAFEEEGKIENKHAYALLLKLNIKRRSSFEYWKLATRINSKSQRISNIPEASDSY